MKGFDPKYKDFPDYILSITKEIWENRGISALHDYYVKDIIVRSPLGIVNGNEGVIAATMATLSEFPDRTLFGEDVIWSGSPEEGFLSSHRIISTATHANDGVYGNASGKKLRYRIIADCHAINNLIDDEWLIRDQGAIVKQLGLNIKDYARKQIISEGGIEEASRPFTSAIDITGPYKGKGNDNEWGLRLADTLQSIMHAEFSVIPNDYDRAASLFYPSDEVELSHKGADKFWMSLRSSFPNSKFEIHHIIGRNDELMPPRAAVRWSLEGKHEGVGRFGKPTNKNIHIMGITHVEYGPYGVNGHSIRREYTLFDEVAIWKQILLQKGEI